MEYLVILVIILIIIEKKAAFTLQKKLPSIIEESGFHVVEKSTFLL